jgi:hypothetical protein
MGRPSVALPFHQVVSYNGGNAEIGLGNADRVRSGRKGS